ncbi:hypothetical protein [Lysobacter sp. Hz 25]|uniref:hypothetical protein n=1 Tax=Lysobacter sp. Hz 25 TaxID=3383698 RepID=UPI0038D39B52
MSAPNITEAPWHACEHGDYSDYGGNCVVILGDDMTLRIAVVLGDNTDETLANARLMAAAPKLFAALDQISGLSRALRAGGPDPMDLEELSDALAQAVDVAHEAIAEVAA